MPAAAAPNEIVPHSGRLASPESHSPYHTQMTDPSG